VRALAARSLGALGVREAVPALAARLTDRSWWVRRHAAYALARLDAPGRAALEHVRAASPDRYAREMAAEALDGGWPPREARRA
jgi:HEAT repeat protein